MSLQYKISALILAVFTLFGIFTYAVQQRVILPSFLALETSDAEQGMERAVQAIRGEIGALAQPARDWSSWDDTYRFLQDNNRGFRESNLTRVSVHDLLDVDLLYFVDTSGNVRWSAVYDPQSGEEIKLAELSDSFIPTDHPLTAPPHGNSTNQGLLNTTRGPLLVVSKPSLDSNSQGPSHGTLVFGRFLDSKTVRRISKQAGVQLAALPLRGAALDAEQTAVIAELGASDKSVVRAGDAENHVYQVLPDIFGHPALLVEVKTPRLITTKGRAVNRDARLALALGALVLLLVLVVGLRYLVLRPIADLIVHADEVGRRDDLSIRLDTNRADELGELAREFNQMVERLADARKALLEQSHQAGFAELASGVMHNIGNAITPLKVRVANLESALREAPVAELDMALRELDNASTPSARRTDLRAFADLAAREFAALITTTREQMVGVARQIDHVQRILNDQESLSRAARILKPVDVAKLASDSVKLLGTEVLNSLQIEYDDSLQSVGKALGSPVALQQIVVNLLKNSAESIQTCAPPRVGNIRLSAKAQRRDGREMIGLRVSDNGMGIAPENLSRIFERGFTTKSRASSGRGLHWCSITATALGGQITIDSAGPGRGVSMSLWLPQA
jgi:two-component system, NtrC family, sensor kinase